MISKSAIREFINRERDDFSYLKKLDKKDLLLALHDVAPDIDASALMVHQIVALLLGIAYPQFALWMAMGTGKTLTVIKLLEHWRYVGKLRKAIVLVPSQEAVYTWANELEKWKCPVPYIELADGTSEDKMIRWMELEEGIGILAYPSMRSMLCALEKQDGKKKNKMVASRALIEEFCRALDMLVMDESTEAKAISTLTFKICRAISKRVSMRYALAGRPFGRDPIDLWAQQYLCDHGASLGPTIELYREAFFEKKPRYFGGPYSFDYKFRKTMAPDLYRLSSHRALRYSAEECLDLPPCTKIIRKLTFPPETLEYYKRVVEHLLSLRNDQIGIKNDFVRMRQLSSGFLGVASDEFGAKSEVVFENNPKLETLIELLKQIPNGSKAVVFHEFVHSGKIICERLRKEKIKHVAINGATKDRKTALKKFLDDPEYEVLVLNHQIGAYSLNLQVANVIIFFETPLSAIDRDQAERRCWRQGQLKRVLIYDLVMDKSVDGRILDYHRAGGSLFRAVLKDPREIFERFTA